MNSGTQGVKFFKRISLTTVVPFDLGRPNSAGIHVWRGVCLGLSHAATSTGRGPSAPQLCGFPSVYAYTIWCRTTKFDVV